LDVIDKIAYISLGLAAAAGVIMFQVLPSDLSGILLVSQLYPYEADILILSASLGVFWLSMAIGLDVILPLKTGDRSKERSIVIKGIENQPKR